MVNSDPVVTRALDALAPPVAPDVDAAWQRQRALRGATGTGRARLGGRLAASPGKLALLPLAAGLLLALSLFAAPVRSLAAQLLTVFRVQDVTPISVEHLAAPPDLSQLGDMSPNPRDIRMQPVQASSIAAAAAQAGFSVRTPRNLPAGVAAEPAFIAVTRGATVNFTFRAQKAAAYLASTGHKDVSLPPKFDGATLTLHVPPAVSLAYLPPGTSLAGLQAAASSQQAGGKPDTAAVNRALTGAGVVVLQARSPELDASGVSADELREFLLSLPGIPEDTRSQLRAIGDWRNTLPVPAPAGSNMHKVSVNGAPGVAGKNGSAQAVLWVRDGMVFAATGTKVDEKALLALAASM
jgi:hypothetical protein